jgi:SAM-dependent methyltransferase
MHNRHFDAALAAHVIYHIHADEQEAAVRRMISLIRPGGRIVFIYSNPNSPSALPGEIIRTLRGKPKSSSKAPWPLYFHAHPLRWWHRFADRCEISLLPWAPLGTRASKLLSNNTIAGLFFSAAKLMEDHAPGLAARLWHNPIIVLDVR